MSLENTSALSAELPAALPYVLTLGAALCFSSASLIFAQFSRRLSVLWVNTVKALVAALLLVPTIAILYATGLAPAVAPDLTSLGLLALSGALGLGIGDLFLLDAYTRLGVSRTLILYGFQPIGLGLVAAIFLGQAFPLGKLVAVIFLIACLIIFSLERYKESGHWEIKGLLNALIGVSLDSTGVFISRLAFDHSPELHPLEGHFIRCLGALSCYVVISCYYKSRGEPHRRIRLLEYWRSLEPTARRWILLGCFGGTYLSLCLYLTAVRIGHLGSITAVGITGPMFAALLEALIHKKRPSRYLAAAFVAFMIGFAVLLLN
ncbi:MAG TPA: EamA family transporter [Pseudobdellovibrionaceae bacterium]|nr:EamA family transporter [Pseudobdellovibrionaceae bacterium]